MSELYSIYEESLNNALTRLSTIISTMQNLSKEKTESAINEANSIISESESLIKKLEIEISATTKNEKLLIKHKNSKLEFDKLKKQYFTLQNNYINSKSKDALNLNSSNDGQDINLTNDHENAKESYNNYNKLENGKRIMLEIESGGQQALKNLNQQTKIIGKTLNNLDNENEVLDNANTLLFGMVRRENKNKVIIAVFAAIILLVILTVVLVKIM